jgi:hypothetical protein
MVERRAGGEEGKIRRRKEGITSMLDGQVCHETRCISEGFDCGNCVFDSDSDEDQWKVAIKKGKPKRKKEVSNELHE